MSTADFTCWKCRAVLEELLLPVPRLAKCPACQADLHTCRMCEFFDITVSNSCREPVAEKVNDKARANFCGYFQPGHREVSDEGADLDKSLSGLESLFGMEKGDSGIGSSNAEQSRQELDALFDLDDRKDND